MARIILGQPNEKQKLFLTARERYVAYGGARGGGKSWAVRFKAVATCAKYPGFKCLILRRTYPELEQNHIAPLRKLTGGAARYNDSKKTMSFGNGSEIVFGYCENERDTDRYQGHEYDFIFLDEATHFTYRQFIDLTACCRGTNGYPKRIYLPCNPGGVGHEWVKRLFIDREYRQGEDPAEYRFIQALARDNDALMAAQPEYLAFLDALPEDRRRAWRDGDWDAFLGQYFREFDRRIHVSAPEAIPAHWQRFRSLDYGLDCTCCLWWAVSPDGVLTVYRELWQPGLILSDAARKILEMSPDTEEYRYTAASPDLWNRRQDSGLSGFEIMTREGLRGLIPANDERINGWRTLREYLKPVPDAFGGKSAGIRLFDTCLHAVRDLPRLQYDERVIEDAASEPHEITHAPEALRYGVMSRPPLSVEPEVKHENFAFERKEKPRTAPGRSFMKY